MVADAFVDPALLAHMGAQPGLGSPELLERVEEDDVVALRVRYRYRGQLSGAVTRVVDRDRLTWVQELELDRSRARATFRIVPDHYANLLRSTGTITVVDDGGGGAVRVTAAQLKVTVPFVGGSAERAIVSGLRDHAAAEQRVVAEWLAAQRR